MKRVIREELFFRQKKRVLADLRLSEAEKEVESVFPARKENFISHRSFSPGLFRRADLTRGWEKRRDVGGGHGSFPSIDSWQGANGTRPAAKHLRAIPASKRRFTPVSSRNIKPFALLHAV